MIFRDVPAGEPPASELMAAMFAEMEALYRGDGPLDPQWNNPVPGGMDEPGGACLLGEADGTPVCVGGLRDLGDGACEIKRMYVLPEARRQGLARQLLAVLEDRARELGYTHARLDTGRHQPHAQRMYEESGYLPIPDYNGNIWASFWGEKAL